MRSIRFPLPIHVSDFTRAIMVATPEAIERMIADMRGNVPEEKRREVLRPKAHRFAALRMKDMKRAGMKSRHAIEFADAEARWRQYLADVTGDDRDIELTFSSLVLTENGEISLEIMIGSSQQSAEKIERAFGPVWTDKDLDPNARGPTH